MKHASLLIVLAVAGYLMYQLANPKERKLGIRLLTRHGLRLLVLLIVVFLLLAAAVQHPSIQLF